MRMLLSGITFLLLLIRLSDGQTGSVLYEYWTGISGTEVGSLTGDPRYPSNPSGTSYLTQYFEAPSNWNDNYGARIRGIIHPPVTGNYIFYIASDDQSELWLSTDDKPANKVKIAWVSSYTDSRQWDKYPEQQSAAIHLEAGRRYYIEGLHKDGSQNDNFAVGWQMPGSNYERPIPVTRLSPVTDDDDYSLWAYSAKIYMNTTSSGANVAGIVTQIPILIRLNQSNFNFSEALGSGEDIRFSKADGTHLYYQIERWDSLSGEAQVWVRVDTVYGNNSTQYIYMHWGKFDAVSRSNGTAVFDTTNGFMGVWHLNQNPGGTYPQLTDASSRHNHGVTNGSMSTSNSITGVVDRGVELDGVDDYINTTVQFNNPVAFTLSLWFKTTTVNGGKLIGFGNQQTGQSSSYDRTVWMDTAGKIHFGIYNGSVQSIGTSTAFNDGLWHQLTAQVSSAGMKLFIDGILSASNAGYTTPENYNGYWRIGYDNMTGWPNPPNTFYIKSAVDEAVIAHTARSEHWIKLNYENIKSSSSFITVDNFTGKPVINLTQLVLSVPESLNTVPAFAIGATIGVPDTSAINIQVKLGYYGNAQSGVDYAPLASNYSLTIPADSVCATRTVDLIPIEDLLEEGNETLFVFIQPDTSYRVGSSDTIAIIITDNDQVFPPVITVEPGDTSLLTGDVAVFKIQVSGSPPFTYQWRKNGIPTGPNSETFITPQVSMSDSGALFDCIVSNSQGSDTSRQAFLHVSVRPEAVYITRQPLSLTLVTGDTAIFEVTSAGSPPYQYQWYKNDTIIPGETGQILKVGPLSLNNNGEKYHCVVSNISSSIESNKALLTVRRPSSHTLIITGDLFTSKNVKVGINEDVNFDFVVNLYRSATDTVPLYTESFLDSNNQSIKVKNGKFAIQLGAGRTNDDLMAVVRENANIFVSFTISPPGCSPETLNRRVPLTASPYALSSLPSIIKGNVNPDSAAIVAPIGTHYVRTSTNATYIKTFNGWSELTD
jgi:hypothetical protein